MFPFESSDIDDVNVTNRQPLAFTYVEVMATVIVIGIASAMVIPTMGDTAQTQLVKATELLVADLAYAQVESISHSDDPRVMVFDTAAKRYFIAATSDTTTPIINTVTKGNYEVTWGQARAHVLTAVTFGAISADGDSIIGFGQYGQLDQTEDATIVLVAGTNQITVTLDAITGEASIGTITAVPE